MLTVLRLIADLAGQSAQRAGMRLARASGLFMLAMVFLMIGLTGFAVAAFILLARVLDPLLAALLIGSLSCLIGAVLLLVARAQANPQRLFHATPDERQARLDLTAKLETLGSTGFVMPLVLAVLSGLLVAARKK